MRLKYIDSDIVYSTFSFDAKAECFLISDGNDNIIEYKPPIDVVPCYEPTHFSCVFLSNDSPACTENSIYQVYVGSTRIGWIFPVQALFSNEHNYSGNVYFLKYAFVAYYHLLEMLDDVDNNLCPSEFSVADYYESTKCLLVRDLDNCAKINNFNFDNYVVSLFQYGYSFTGHGNLDADFESLKDKTRLTLHAISPDLGTQYINDLFKIHFPQLNDDVTKFYFYYQIIEMMISTVFRVKFNNLLSEMKEDHETLFELRDDITKIASEKRRVRILFNEFVNGLDMSLLTDLNNACAQFLKQNQKGVSENNFYENLYSTRCFLVHKLYSLNRESDETLKNINSSFLNILIRMLYNFKIPNN